VRAMLTLFMVLFAVLWVGLSQAQSSVGSVSELMAGTARIDITPPLGHP
jgi:hypothetical protein